MIGRRTNRAREAVEPAVLALLLVMSLAAPFATGLAAADTVKKTVDAEGAEYVAADLSDVSGEYTVRIWVSPKPGGGQEFVYEDTHTAATDGTDIPAYRNSKAYENVTIEITGSGVPSDLTIGTGEAFGRSDWRNKDVWTSSGGDRDFKCGPMERASQAINPAIEITDCNARPNAVEANTTGLDADEAKTEIYQSAVTNHQSSQNFNATMSNYLEDTKTVALLKGKEPYIRSLEKGETQSAAEAAATNNITDYYSKKELNLLAEWETQVSHLMYLSNTAESETGISEQFVNATHDDSATGQWVLDHATPWDTGTTQYTLQNGTTVDVTTLIINHTWYDTQNNVLSQYDEESEIGPTTGDGDVMVSVTSDVENYQEADSSTNLTGFATGTPGPNYERGEAFDFSHFAPHLSDIEQQTDEAVAQLETFSQGTYDEYQAGDINASDLIDPYVLQSEFNPGDEYQGWAAAQLALLGTNQPTNLSRTGYMNITIDDGTPDGEMVQGIVQSPENPPSGQFAVGETYNPANIGGTQWITTENRTRRIEGNFKVNEVTTTDGETRQNFSIQKKTYTTANADELVKLNEQLSLLREEISAREQNLNSGVGGGGLLGGGSQTVVLVLVAGVVVVVLMSNGGRR